MYFLIAFPTQTLKQLSGTFLYHWGDARPCYHIQISDHWVSDPKLFREGAWNGFWYYRWFSISRFLDRDLNIYRILLGIDTWTPFSFGYQVATVTVNQSIPHHQFSLPTKSPGKGFSWYSISVTPAAYNHPIIGGDQASVSCSHLKLFVPRPVLVVNQYK